MAKIKGTFLTPGVSKNGRLYTKENISKAVSRMQEKLKSGEVIPMHTSHMANAGGDVTATAAKVTRVDLNVDGSASFEASTVGTRAGQDVAALNSADAIKHVSIFGNWVGDVTHDEEGNETAPDLEVSSIDFTHRPGVASAKIEDIGALAGARVWESLEDVEIMPEAPAAEVPSLLAMLEAAERHQFVDGFCSSCEEDGTYGEASDPKKPYGDVTYADPGYQADKKKRYPIDTKGHARAAWSYINKAKNAAKYTAAQVARMKSKIKGAAKRFGVNIAAEQEELDALSEHLGKEFFEALEAYVSSSIDHTNDDGTNHTVSVGAYGVKDGDIAAHSKRVAKAALGALVQLNPDKDLGLAGENDNDMECAACGFESVPCESMFCPQCGLPIPGAEAAPAEQEEDLQMEFTPTKVKAAFPEATLDESKKAYSLEEYVAIASSDAATKAVKAAEDAKTEAAKKLAEEEAAKSNLSEDEKALAAARALVAEADKAAADKPASAAQVAEIVAKAVAEATAQVRKDVIDETRRGAGPARRGIVEKLESLKESEVEQDPKKLSELSSADFRSILGKTFDPLLPQQS